MADPKGSSGSPDRQPGRDRGDWGAGDRRAGDPGLHAWRQLGICLLVGLSALFEAQGAPGRVLGGQRRS